MNIPTEKARGRASSAPFLYDLTGDLDFPDDAPSGARGIDTDR
jgi:hypothetical protein